MVSISLTDTELIDEVRTSMGDLGEATVPDDTIIQQWERVAKPYIDDNVTGSPNQDKIDNAAIFYTAELSFKAWVQKDRMTTSGQDTYIDLDGTIDNLEKRAASALERVDITHIPTTGPADFVDHSAGFYDI